MRIGSLFSGIGGLELGLELAGIGHTVWQVESNPYCRAVLAKHWPHAVRHDDVRTVGRATLAPVDLICGGFPCQDVSSAGKRAGLSGARSGLWTEYARIVSEMVPAWIVVENVTSGARKWVDAVRWELGRLGYATLPVPLAAGDVGAPHHRARIFIVGAHAHSEAVRNAARGTHSTRGPSAGLAGDDGTQGHVAPHAHGDGQPVVPFHDALATPPHASDAGSSGREGPGHHRTARGTGLAGDPWRPPVPPVLRVADGLSRGVDSPRKRISALGNAVVPQCAEVIGHVIHLLGGTDA